MCAAVVSVMQLGYCLQLVMRSWVHEQQKTGNRVIIQYLPVELGDEVAGPPGSDGWCQVADECPGAIS